MSNEATVRYSDEDLREFETLIQEKLDKAKTELKYIKETLNKTSEYTLDSGGPVKMLEDGADAAERESLTQLAARQQKFINQLESAMVRIKNKTYGVCVDTGKLISKERLRAVPHTMHSIEAKLAKNT
jgi:DnaK suppressor protein